MRILIVNTSENTGGAAVAAHRLMEALNNNGEKAKMLVRDKQTDDISVVELPHSWRQRWNFLRERLTIFRHLGFKRTNLFGIDIANTGTDITKLKEFKEADVIHLHWINQGMLSLKSIRKIVESGKAIVWTMHDAWPMTGICHVTLGCHAFHSRCQNCKYLAFHHRDKDLSTKIWKQKKLLFEKSNIYFVACSHWLEVEAKKSSLLKGKQITNIPNPIDTRQFYPGDKTKARAAFQLPQDKRLLLFAAQRVTNQFKGIDHLEEACRQLAEQNPEIKDKLALMILGGNSSDCEFNASGFEVFPFDYTTDTHKIVQIFQAADAFVLPSLSENLPNTIMEAMACGVPCIGFKVGGIPEMIDHRRNGYIAKYRNAEDLAEGIKWVLFDADWNTLSIEALHKVQRRYSQQSVALDYIEVYNEAIVSKDLKI